MLIAVQGGIDEIYLPYIGWTRSSFQERIGNWRSRLATTVVLKDSSHNDDLHSLVLSVSHTTAEPFRVLNLETVLGDRL